MIWKDWQSFSIGRSSPSPSQSCGSWCKGSQKTVLNIIGMNLGFVWFWVAGFIHTCITGSNPGETSTKVYKSVLFFWALGSPDHFQLLFEALLLGSFAWHRWWWHWRSCVWNPRGWAMEQSISRLFNGLGVWWFKLSRHGLLRIQRLGIQRLGIEHHRLHKFPRLRVSLHVQGIHWLGFHAIILELEILQNLRTKIDL